MTGLPRSVLARTQQALVERGLHGLMVVARSARDPDLAPFVGGAHLGESLLWIPTAGEPRLAVLSPMEREEAARTGLLLVSPEELEVGRWARETQHPFELLARLLERLLALADAPAGERLALAGHAGSGRVHAACRELERQGHRFEDGGEILRGARKHKDAGELAEIRRAAVGTMAAMRAAARTLVAAAADTAGQLWLGGERLRTAQLRSAIARALAEHGLEQPEGNLVAAGRDAGVPHNQGADERLLCAGEAILVDLFPKGLRFADCTRVFCVGGPVESVARAYWAVRGALGEAVEKTRPGVRGWALQELVCSRFAASGYATALTHPGTTVGYVHGLGHGVGCELHEEPSFRKETGAEGLLDLGDVFTLEPGLYEPAAGGYGVRLEDLYWLGPEGLENLTPLPYDLDPAAF